ncbi:GH24 family phage-related lysozyme (muramidase) [Sphingomonas naasensis]|uniref:Lysozyme n=1 Tax=Sphingomonas naasensis TaxID=1344951 RepID=A0A4S1WU74_9SPHN|nr:lysozyme [Sphingomonas naasensis]NIJ18483.1 GH24 family phage-related lysozyme (muramidase) [Sphingomonas naasensis]TGX45740.1 lysozyme [Sphingomonas naasensis]
MTRRIGPKGRALIQQFEGCAKRRADGRLDAYPDPGTGGDPWTIGWGSTGPDIRRGTVWTQAQADERFEADVHRFAAKVDALLGDDPTKPGQFDAMVSLAYNIGLGNFASSTLLRLHRAGNFEGAAAQFARWNKAAGRVLPGLTKRRAAERALYELPA